ncbi:MAG: hypothetical protein ACLFV3_09170 [Phycisphaeraceae bacterium]
MNRLRRLLNAAARSAGKPMRWLTLLTLLLAAPAAIAGAVVYLGREQGTPIVLFALFGGWSVACLLLGYALGARQQPAAADYAPPLFDAQKFEQWVKTGQAEPSPDAEEAGDEPLEPPHSFGL